MSLNREKMKERLEKLKGKTTFSEKSEMWWKPTQGEEKTVRILETKDGDPFKDYWFHYGMDKYSGFLCPKRNFREDCPVCDFASKMYNNGDDSEKEAAKKLFSKQRFFAAVVELESETRKLLFTTPKIWGFPKTVYGEFLEACNNPDYANLTDVKNGNDIKVSLEKSSAKVKYPSPRIKIRPKETPLCEDMTNGECEEILEKVPNFIEHMQRKTTEEVQEILNKWSNETSFDGEMNESKDLNEKDGLDLKEQKKSEIDEAFDELLG